MDNSPDHASDVAVPVSRPDTEGWSPHLVASLVVIVLTLETLAVGYMMISIALPHISTHFRTDQGAWLLTAFVLVGAVASPLLGRLADMYGKRRILLACMTGAALGSLLSALAESYPLLVAGRALTGLLTPCLFLGYSLIRDVYPPRTVPLAVSIATTGMGFITVASPFLAGWLIDGFGFRSIFWFNVMTLAVLSVLLVVTTPESSVRARERLDLIGAVLIGSGLASVLIGISFGPAWGWTSTSTISWVTAGVVLIGSWLYSATVIRDPLIDLRLLRRRPVVLTALGAGACYGAGVVYSLILPIMCMTPESLGLGFGFGVDATGFAVFQAPFGIGTLIGGIFVGLMVPRIRPRDLMAAGLLLETVAALASAGVHDHKALLIAFIAVFGLGQGLIYAAIPNLVIAAVVPQLQATASSLVQVSQGLASAIVPVVAMTLLNSHIATVLDGSVFYTDGGVTIVFYLTAGIAAAGAVAALCMPRTIESLELEQPADSPADQSDRAVSPI